MMTITQCGLPIALVVLIFLFRLLIDRKISVGDFIFSILELPQSIILLGVSLVVAFTILSKENVEKGLLIFVIYLGVTLLVVFFWRRAVRYFESNKPKMTTLLGFLSYFLSVPALFYSIKIIVVSG